MSVLDRLCIRGIRSFGPSEDEKVKFSTPLTLFLGQNGCGKTTIIESLKFALTGELPAGTEGGKGFINDPKLSNKSITKAYVKLRFKDCKGDFITVGRFVEVSTKVGGKLQFKTLTPSIRWENTAGQYDDISGRCADIDIYCSQKLNVSKAIINNVIFCHQENSAWPLEEAKKLKERFDEIFGSTEYNKCVDRFRKLIKEKKNNIKVLKEQFEQKRMAKKATERIKESLNAKEEQLQLIQTEIQKREEEIEPLQKRLDEINDVIDAISALHQKLTGLEKSLEGVIEHQTALKKHLDEEYEGTDKDLENEIANFHVFQGDIEKQIKAMEDKKRTLENALLDKSKQLQKLQEAFGTLKEQENQHLKRGEEMNELIAKTKIKLNVVAELSETIPDVLHTFKTALKAEEIDFAKLKNAGEAEEKRLQEIINDVRDKFAGAKESFSSKNKLIIETKKKKDVASVKITTLTESNSQIDCVGKKIKEYEESLNKKRADLNEEQEQQEIDELDTKITQREQLQGKLERDYKTLQQNYVAEQNIDREKNLIIEKKKELESIRQKHEQNFETLFKGNLPQEKMEQAVKIIQKREEEEVKSITKRISEHEKKVTGLESTLKHTRDTLLNLKQELNKNKNKIEKVCKGKRFSDVLKQSTIKREKLQKDKGTYRSAKTLFEGFIDEFEADKPCCPVCETDFSGRRGVVPAIVTRLKSKIEELPQLLMQTETELVKEEEFYKQLQQLSPVYENIQIVEDTKIPLLEDELQQTTEKLDETKMDLGALNNDLKEPQKMVEVCRKVIFDVALLDRLTSDIRKSEFTVESLKQELVHVSSNRTLDETETELAKLKAELSNLRRQYKTKRDLLDETKVSIQRLNGRLQMEREKKLELQKLVQEQPLLEKQIEEYDASIIQLEEERTTLSDTIAKLQKDLNEAEENRYEVTRKNKKEFEAKRIELDGYMRLIDEIQKLYTIRDRYENGGSKAKLESVVTTMEETKGKLGELDKARKILNDKILEKKEEMASQESKLRALKDNKELRDSRRRSEELQTKVSDLRKQIGNHNSRSICDERAKVIQKIDLKQKAKSIKTGELNTVQQTIREYQKELTKKEHKEAITEFKKKSYEVKVEELSVVDLELYTVALETSILKFHKERMTQINMTIRDLWRTIYKGNDIDHIEIQTVAEVGGSGVNRRRSYTYRVVQVKKGVELEMRGRCSAGQRVLACLVIRMALAETFSANCGILALDEPTTNLDRDNILSLSDALSKIITAREKQKSFQLLIITHDEEFLQTLTRDQSVSHFFRVQRNAEGFSEIRSEVL